MNASHINLLSVLLLCGLLAGCGNGEERDFTRAYLDALERYPGAPVEPAWLDRFVGAYGDFNGAALRQRINDIYAPELYFNDTLKTMQARSSLVDYLGHTAERLESMELSVLDRHYSGRDAYLRWTMRTRFQAGWKEVDTTTLGMTHLRFNDQGRVVLHQDFWDSRQGVFQHIPVLGGLIESIRKDL